MNANTYSHQNRRPKMDFSSSSNTRVDIDSEDKPKARKRSDSSEFDLHQLYHNALECLINCNRTIKSLREQSTSKDEQIAMLEVKIVQMSLELASSKELQDEQTQQLYRLKRRISSVGLNDDDDDGECAPHHQTSKKVQPSLMVDDSPVSVVSAPDIPYAFWMPSLRASPDINDPITHNDEGRKGHNDSSTNGVSAVAKGNNVNSSVSTGKVGIIARQCASDTALTATRGKRRQGRGRLTGSLNESASARTLANIGHFFQGLNGRNDEDVTTAEKASLERVVSSCANEKWPEFR